MELTAQEAYAEAEQRVEEARAEGATILDFSYLPNLKDVPPLNDLPIVIHVDLDNTQISDLTPIAALPHLMVLSLADTQVSSLEPLQHCKNLELINCNNTHVNNLTPISALRALKHLGLGQTPIADISPLQNITTLRSLSLWATSVADISALQVLSHLIWLTLNDTEVRDLRPIAQLEFNEEVEDLASGLSFRNTPAAASSPELTELSEIEDDTERTQKTLAYLRSIPPYPDPLPWDVKKSPKAPEPDTGPRVQITDDGKLDLEHVPLDQSDHDDPLKARMFERLRAAVSDLARLGNRYPELSAPANALNDIFSGSFEDADLLDIHIEIATLTDLVAGNAQRHDPLDQDCLDTLRKVTRLGPPLTLGNPDVELFEARNLQYAQQKRDEAVVNSERTMAQALIDSPLLTERAAHFGQTAVNAPDEGRTAGYRISYVKNMLLVGISKLSKAVAMSLLTEEAVTALKFISANREAIMIVASSWSEQGHIWAADLIARSMEMLRKYKR
ncbi:hypothetical protein GGR95_003236 [Sulfitobacter undariae]|uniref:Uncharacterized protein n=1 Tax=Sulfitobacter undariae TaxID=1563671 RepID=A0A7W6ED34_9RHOB|nr:hypothetical protein [Sulfitobacter undariae]MBB3995579.1 hypothetical protein [Sulfitobacter undariae]